MVDLFFNKVTCRQFSPEIPLGAGSGNAQDLAAMPCQHFRQVKRRLRGTAGGIKRRLPNGDEYAEHVTHFCVGA